MRADYFGGGVVVVVVLDPGGVVVDGPLGGVVVVGPPGGVVVVVPSGEVVVVVAPPAGAAELSVAVVVVLVALASPVSAFLAQPPSARLEAARSAPVAISAERQEIDVMWIGSLGGWAGSSPTNPREARRFPKK
jgi:hypothetical protein